MVPLSLIVDNAVVVIADKWNSGAALLVVLRNGSLARQANAVAKRANINWQKAVLGRVPTQHGSVGDIHAST